MENDKLEELFKLYLSFIPLYNKCNTFYMNKNRADDLCNKNQSMALMMIGKAEVITPTTLSKFINLEKGSLTTLIDSLVEKGLVTRTNSPEDRRKLLLSLTPDGIKYMETIEEQAKNGMHLMVASLEDSEIEQMHASLNSLVEIMRKISNGIN